MHPPTEPNASEEIVRHRRWRRMLRLSIRLLILSCAFFFFGLAIRRAFSELSKSEVPLNWNSIGWLDLALSVFSGMLALVPPCIAWQFVLRDFGQVVHWRNCFYAYFLGHLGKYVPGKAMAVLLRVGQLHRHRVAVGPAVLSVFIETLTGFATGGILGAILLQWIDCPSWLRLSALAGIPLAIVSLLPHPFRWILGPMVRTRIGKSLTTLIVAIDGWMMLRTVLLAVAGWTFQGVALWFVLQSLNGVSTGLMGQVSGWHVLIVCIASMSLGGLAGFLSMLPGGAIARELASIGVLVSVVPQPIAVIATVLVRLTSILAEFLMVASTKWIDFRYSAENVRGVDADRQDADRQSVSRQDRNAQ